MDQTSAEKLTSGKLLAKNAIWNIIGQVLPMLIALIALPFIINGLGNTRFGILSICWVFVGYSSIFDLGITQSLTHLISKKIGEGSIKDLPVLIWTALLIILFIGIALSITIFLLTPLLVSDILKIPQMYVTETIYSLYFISIYLPLVIINACLIGILEAFQKFNIINMLRFPVAISNYAAPLLILPFTKDLSVIILALIIFKFFAFIAYFIACTKTVNNLLKHIRADRNYIKPLLSFGGWISVGNIFSEFQYSMDKFLLASIVSVSVVAYYTTPFDLLIRMFMIPHALMGVMFPALSAAFINDKKKAIYLYNKSLLYTALLLIFPVLTVLIFAKQGLSFWINPNFGEHSYRVAQIIIISVFFLCLNKVNCSFIQASGRSDIPGKLSLFEIIISIPVLFFCIKHYGLIGVAIAVLIRSTINIILLYTVSQVIINRLNKKAESFITL